MHKYCVMRFHWSILDANTKYQVCKYCIIWDMGFHWSNLISNVYFGNRFVEHVFCSLQYCGLIGMKQDTLSVMPLTTYMYNKFSAVC